MKKQTLRTSVVVSLVVVPMMALMAMAALNGGTAPTTGVWTSLSTTLDGILKSDLIIGLALISLLGAVWQVAHGRGYGMLMTVLSIMALAFIGPGMVTSIGTATPADQVGFSANTSVVSVAK